jgi:hypothetical protein
MFNRLFHQFGLYRAAPLSASAMELIETYSSGAEIDIDAVLRHERKIWRVSVLSETEKKKKIIINDWGSIYNQHSYNSLPECALWSFFLNQGFEIYVWTGTLHQIQQPWEFERTLKNVSPIHPDDLLKQLAEKYHLERDECYIAGFGETSQLLQQPDIKRVVLGKKGIIEYLYHWCCVLSADKILEGGMSASNFHYLLSTLPTEPKLGMQLTRLSPTSKPDYLAAFQQFLVRHRRLHLIIPNFTEQARVQYASLPFHELDKLSLTVNIGDPHFVKTFLKQASRLTDLSLRLPNGCTYDYIIPSLPSFLEHLELKTGSFLSHSLDSLSQQFPHLKQLEFTELQLYLLNCDFIPISTLTEMNIVDSGYNSMTILGKLLTIAPTLKKLNLHLSRTRDDNTISTISLPSTLEELNISDTYGEIITNILINSLDVLPNLKKIIFTYPNIEADSFSSKNSMPNLREINASNSDLMYFGLASLLNNSPNLEILNLSNCSNISSHHALSLYFGLKYPLHALEELDLSHATLSCIDFYALLKELPNLKRMNLSYTLRHGAGFELKTLPSSLEALSVSSCVPANSILKEDSFYNLLLANRHSLKKLTLALQPDEWQYTMSSILSLLPFILPELEELNIENHKLTYVVLRSYLDKTPKLQTLNLSGLRMTDHDRIHYTIPQMSALRELNVSGTFDDEYVAYTLVYPLLLAAPGLKKLIIQDSFLSREEVDYIVRQAKQIGVQIEHSPHNPSETLAEPLKVSTTSGGFAQPQASLDPRHLLDETTTGGRHTLKARAFFYPKQHQPTNVDGYRLKVYTDIEVGTSTTLKPLVEKNLIEVTVHQQDTPLADQYLRDYAHTPDVFLGMLPIQGTGPIALPSLSANREEILALHTDPDVKLTLSYCKAENLYYVTPAVTLYKPVSLSFLLKSDASWQSLKKLPFDLILNPYFDVNGRLRGVEALHPLTPLQQLQWLYHFFQNEYFSEGPLEGTYPNNDLNLMNALLKQRKGVCRHKAVLFKAMATALNIPCSVIENDVHAFVEVRLATVGSLKLNLGGGVGQLDVEELPPLTVSENVPAAASEPADELPHPLTTPVAMPTPIETELVTQQPLPPPTDAEATAIHAIPTIFDLSTNPYNTWDTEKIEADNATHYYQEWHIRANQLAPGKKNILIHLDTTSPHPTAIDTFLQTAYQQHNHRVFYVHHLDDLRETVSIINEGSYSTTPSTLARFLQEAKEGDTLIVNWSEAKAKHMRFNVMFDNERTLFNKPLHPGLVICGLLDKHQLMGDEFYSRARQVNEWPEKLTSPMTLIPLTETRHKDELRIHFYDNDWKSVLMGKATIDAYGKFIWQEGVIERAIREKKTGVQLRNAPWHLPEFRLLMNKLLITRVIETNGAQLMLPTLFEIKTFNKPYDFSKIPCVLYTNQTMPTRPCFVLNTLNYAHFIKMIRIDNQSHRMTTQAGLLALHKNQSFSIYVTTSLSDAQWAQFFNTVKKHNITLKIYTAPNVTLPDRLPPASVSTEPDAKVKHHYPLKTIQSNDPDMTLKELEGELILINRMTTYADLVESISVKNKEGAFQFTQTDGPLVQSLNKGKDIILQGEMSPLLATQLESLGAHPAYLLINGKPTFYPDRHVTLLTSKINPLSTAKTAIKHVLPEEVWLALNLPTSFKNVCEELYKRSNLPPFSYKQLEAIYKHYQDKPTHNPFKPFLRLREDYVKLKPIIEAVCQEHGMQKSKDRKQLKTPAQFIDARLQQMESALKQSCYVFLVGPSGTGKSTFVLKTFKNAHKEAGFFHGREKYKDWWNSKAPEDFLIIDEATLAEPGAFDLFEGLFQNPRTLLIEGQLNTVPPSKKIIFMSNYGHFKGRQQHRFFETHGNIFAFKEFPDSFLEHRILKPLLKDCDTETFNQIKSIFLSVYHWVNDKYPETHPLTPRNLQMMAMRLLVSGNFKAELAAYDEVAGLLDKSERQLLMKEIPVATNKKEAKATIKSLPLENFFLTKHRVNPLRLMMQAFQIRDFRVANKQDPALSQAGTSGVMLEGAPGEGKSALARAFLEKMGYALKDSKAPIEPSEKCYYNLSTDDPVSLERSLMKAFHAGIPVILDEINTQAIEHLLNPLLSGVDFNNQPANNPGFILFGTQNPIHFAKRIAGSDAFLNRFHKINLKEYTSKELIQIATHLSKDKVFAEKTVKEYGQALKYAKEHHKPAPTARHVITHAQNKGKRP